MKHINYISSALVLTLVLLSTNSAFGQLWLQETPRFPVYSRLIRQYKEIKPTIEQGNMTATDRDRALAKLKELRLAAEQLKKNNESDPNGSEELKSRYTMFIGDLDRNTTRLQQSEPRPEYGPLPSGASIRLKANTTIFAPADDVEFRFVVPAGLQGKVWVGLMKSTEPHRDLPYLDPSINITPYQPKTLESRADGVFEYSAPQGGGMYDVRMFDKESGREITTAQFRVEADFVAELRAWLKELHAARNMMEARYGSKAILGTYTAAFATAGSTDPKYTVAWSDWFWVHEISQNRDTSAFALFHYPIEMVSDSLTNIVSYRQPYSNEDVQHYRQGMRKWRNAFPKLFPLYEEYIRIDAEKNRDILDTSARLKTLGYGPGRDAEEKAAARRADARKPRYQAVVGKIGELKARPFFAYLAAQKKPA